MFLDGDMQFDPSSIKTQFTHVYIIVKAEEVTISNGSVVSGYRVAVTTSADVAKFGPYLPNPPVFTDMSMLHNFLMAKCNSNI